jgi:cytochrome c oxidase cbb3-type subunit 3
MSQKDSNEDRLMDHNYDGIQEYDNPMPRWWLYIFYATIVFAVLYWLNVPGIGTGKGRIANYNSEMDAAHAKYGAPGGSKGPVPSEATLLAAAADPAQLGEGKATFLKNCVACHRADAGGLIGPNLTDEFWIHGGKPQEIWKTVDWGVLDKGMPAWGQTLKPDEVLKVVAYVTTLRHTNPVNPKAPQGTSERTGQPAPAAPAAP